MPHEGGLAGYGLGDHGESRHVEEGNAGIAEM